MNLIWYDTDNYEVKSLIISKREVFICGIQAIFRDINS